MRKQTADFFPRPALVPDWDARSWSGSGGMLPARKASPGSARLTVGTILEFTPVTMSTRIGNSGRGTDGPAPRMNEEEKRQSAAASRGEPERQRDDENRTRPGEPAPEEQERSSADG